MSKSILVSDKAYKQLSNIARVLGRRRGRPVDFIEVIDYLLAEHAS